MLSDAEDAGNCILSKSVLRSSVDSQLQRHCAWSGRDPRPALPATYPTLERRARLPCRSVGNNHKLLNELNITTFSRACHCPAIAFEGWAT